MSSVVNRGGNINPNNRNGRGAPLGQNRNNNGEEKFKAFSGAGHSLNDK